MSDVTFSGPLFDGRAHAALTEGARAVREKLASDAERLAAASFAGDIRHGTGRFEHSLTITGESRTYTTHSGSKTYTIPVVVEDSSADLAVTTDLATYGPWLEGTGSRNESTRFKGYHGFRKAAQELDRRAEEIATAVMRPYVARCD